MKMLCTTVLVISFLVGCQAYSAADVYSSLSDEEKIHFLRYYIAKGFLDSQPTDSGFYPGIRFPDDLPIPEDIALTFKTVQIEPEDFPIKLLKSFSEKFNLTSGQALMVARQRCKDCLPPGRYLCMPDGTCVDLGDVGSVCCT